jgi:organic hydroperoxide reductase OsmC/OhrA
MKNHQYQVDMQWTGNKGEGTKAYHLYDRSHVISVNNKPDIPCSSDPQFRGDKTRYNPEELLVSSLSGCHMLWYLHLCAKAGIVVTDYHDQATGTMVETDDGGGYFSEVTLHPVVTITDMAQAQKAEQLHEDANKLCFIANSCKFPVHHRPLIKGAE